MEAEPCDHGLQAGRQPAGEIRLPRWLRDEEMVSEAAQRTAVRCAGRQVLAIKDTTVHRSESVGGDYVHVALAVDADDGAILSLIDAQFLGCTDGKRTQRQAAAIGEKESFRWLQADAAASVYAGAASVTMISDRESDIFDAFALRPDGVDLLVRAAHDRALRDGGRLFAAVDGLAVAARFEVDLPAQPGRKRRTARLEMRFSPVALAQPRAGQRQNLPGTVELTMVDIRETDPPTGQTAVHWRLLTTRPATTADEARQVVELYRRRWAIEQMFRTLKTQGYDIEGLRIEDAVPRNKLITAALVAAVHV